MAEYRPGEGLCLHLVTVGLSIWRVWQESAFDDESEQRDKILD